jgi:hypothetical protein
MLIPAPGDTSVAVLRGIRNGRDREESATVSRGVFVVELRNLKKYGTLKTNHTLCLTLRKNTMVAPSVHHGRASGVAEQTTTRPSLTRRRVASATLPARYPSSRTARSRSTAVIASSTIRLRLPSLAKCSHTRLNTPKMVAPRI